MSITVFDLHFVFENDTADTSDSFYERTWLLLDHNEIEIRDALPRPNTISVKFGISKNAGFILNSHDCDYDEVLDQSDTSLVWSHWTKIDDDFKIARCHFGTDAPVEISVKVRNRFYRNINHTYELFSIDRAIGQTWHQNDSRIKYYITSSSQQDVALVDGESGSNIFGLLDPNPAPFEEQRRIPSTVLRNRELYARGGKVWRDNALGVSIERTLDPREADVILAGYWNQGTEGQENDGRCSYSWACAYIGGPQPPHIGTGITVLFEEPPQFRGMEDSANWTNEYWKYLTRPGEFVYLPGTIAHEFGHTLGIGHAKSGRGLMRSDPFIKRRIPPCGFSQFLCGLGNVDEYALEEIYGDDNQ